jgi:hypothetical protein
MRGTGYQLQERATRLGGLTVRSAIAFLDDHDPQSAAALRAFGEAWLDKPVWVRGFGSRLKVEQEQPVRTVARPEFPWKIVIEKESGPPYVSITAD